MGLTIYAGVTQGEKVSWVFTQNEMCDGEYNEDDFIPNPHFLPNSSINMSEGNAHGVLGLLNIEVKESYFEIPIIEFLDRIKTYSETNPEWRKYFVDHDGGYSHYPTHQIKRMKALAEMAIVRGADVIYGA